MDTACSFLMPRLFFLAIVSIFLLVVLPQSSALTGCGGSCSSDHDCQGKLACISGKCGDDPSVGTHICSGSSSGGSPSSSSSSCKVASYLVGTGHSCNTEDNSNCCVSGKKYPQHHCSPAVTSRTSAILTLNSFAAGGDGGAQSECDGKYHSDSELVVALSTGWYSRGSRCNKKIRITAYNGNSVLAKVVDECDSVNGCDSDHDYQPPCPYNDVDASAAVWKALGISVDDPNYGHMSITWADA